MPELPEVETIRRGLAGYLVGRELEDVRVLDPRLVTPAAPGSIERLLEGRTVDGLRRRGKYLLADLTGDLVAVFHLRMTGSFRVDGDDERHIRLSWRSGTAQIAFHDPRRFGTLVVLERKQAERFLAERLGPEPLADEFDPQAFAARLARHSCAIKAALLDQRVVSGIGNIYADEALFAARLHPATPANSLSAGQVRDLHTAIRAVLAAAIEEGGSTLRDYRTVGGEPGRMQDAHHAYGRGGLPCTHCGSPLHSARIASRTTVWCERCQRPGRRRGANAPAGSPHA